MIMRSMFVKSAFSFGSPLDVLKISVSISDDVHQPFERFELSVQKHRHAKRARVIFLLIGSRSIRRTVHSNDLVKFFGGL